MSDPARDSSSSVSQIISESRLRPQLLADLERFRRNVTVMFTDIKGSTSYFEKHGDVAGLLMVHECNDLLKQCVQRHKGRFIKTIGDAVMAMFDTPVDAVRSAVDMQKSILDVNRPKQESDRVTVRIGLHYGAAIVQTDDLFGDAVNVASRVESQSQAEQIFISETVRDEVAASGEFAIRSLGRFELKGKTERRYLYEVIWKEDASNVASSADHTIFMNAGIGFCVPTLKLQQMRQDGSVGAEQVLKQGALVIGGEDADFPVAGDPLMAPLHARVSVEGGQAFVEDISGGSGVYVRLLETRMLHDGDEILTGSQRFSFREQEHGTSAAAGSGTHGIGTPTMVGQSSAELVTESADGVTQRYPLTGDSVSWGRSQGTFVFPEDRFLSRSHARIYPRGVDFFLEDLNSRNGTYVRTRGKVPVPMGTRIRVGGQILRVMQ